MQCLAEYQSVRPINSDGGAGWNCLRTEETKAICGHVRQFAFDQVVAAAEDCDHQGWIWLGREVEDDWEGLQTILYAGGH